MKIFGRHGLLARALAAIVVIPTMLAVGTGGFITMREIYKALPKQDGIHRLSYSDNVEGLAMYGVMYALSLACVYFLLISVTFLDVYVINNEHKDGPKNAPRRRKGEVHEQQFHSRRARRDHPDRVRGAAGTEQPTH